MGFTTSCFIRRNTREIRQKLEEMGYWQSRLNGKDRRGNCVITFISPYGKGEYMNITIDYNDFEDDEAIDCEEDEELFFALAGMRDDTDKDQWFTNGADWILFKSEGTLLNYEHPYTSLNDDNVNRYFHKATTEEIIEYFKTKR